MVVRNDIFYTIFETRAGWIGAVASSKGVTRITLPEKSKERAESSLGKAAKEAVHSAMHFEDLISKLKSYFKGGKVIFSEELDLSDSTPFQRAVWESTRSIPFGETRSYAWVAAQIGKPQAPRAVGNALGRNPVPIIIPCHRVLASSGKLGGFGGGLVMKQYLLDLEGKKKNRFENKI